MDLAIRRFLLGFGVAVVTALVFGLVFAAGLGTAAALGAGAVIGGATAAASAGSLASATLASALPAAPRGPPADLPPDGADPLSRLRHDLRGALSPALLTADRLLASTDDPAVRRAAETMIETVERATAILAATRPSHPGPGA